MAVTETWLSGSIFNKEILPSGFSIFRKDCASCEGGVLVAVACHLSACLRPSPAKLEVLSLELLLHSSIVIYVVYVPPASCENYWLSLLDCSYSLFSSGIPTFVVGDFNHPDINSQCSLLLPRSPLFSVT